MIDTAPRTSTTIRSGVPGVLVSWDTVGAGVVVIVADGTGDAGGAITCSPLQLPRTVTKLALIQPTVLPIWPRHHELSFSRPVSTTIVPSPRICKRS